MSISKSNKIFISILLIFIVVTLRIIPHYWNFTPVIAATIFSSIYLGRNYSFFVVISSLLITDFIIGFYNPYVMFSVYFSYIVIIISAQFFKDNTKTKEVFLSSFFSSFVFYMVSNFSVWIFTTIYEKSLMGLLKCYVLALPFYRNTFLSTIIYLSMFILVYKLAYTYYSVKTKSLNSNLI